MKRNSLWADREANRDGHEWLAPPPPRPPEEKKPEEAPEPEPRSRLTRWLVPLGSGVASAALVIALLLVTGVVDLGGGGGSQDSGSLPAAAPLQS
ncbi:MAG: hypothetical protein QOH13_1335, partial [Thermoleophilaceae bacterium]|nr:hypothetical protein [Thermoleophilaceae bacterium]